MRIAVVKPDHFGDLILSSAAIRAVLARYSETVLFVARANLPLARFLFGEQVELREANFPHLNKHVGEEVAFVDLRPFDLVLFLRTDGVLNPAWAEMRCRDFIFPVDTHADHQTLMDFAVVASAVGAYDIEANH
jgi:hypothetical protein